jgi:membrane protein
VGISAIQDTLNAVYNIRESRSYIVARIQAIGLTILLTIVVTLGLASMLAGDYFARLAELRISDHLLSVAAIVAVRLMSWVVASALLALTFAVLYYWTRPARRAGIGLRSAGQWGLQAGCWLRSGFASTLHFFNICTSSS